MLIDSVDNGNISILAHIYFPTLTFALNSPFNLRKQFVHIIMLYIVLQRREM